MTSKRVKRIVSMAAAAALVCTAAWYAVAAPIAPAKQDVPSEVRSLIDLHEVEVIVDLGHPIYEHQKFDKAAAKQSIEKMLTEGGLRMTNEPDTPTVRLVLLANLSPQFPEAASYALHLSVEQKVTVERLDRSMYVPTYALVHGGIIQRGQLNDEINRLLPTVIQHFLTRVDAANTTK